MIAGRMLENGMIYLFTAKTSDGELVIIEKQLDAKPGSEIIIQLQRIGTFYTAVYSYDGECWYSLGESIFMNLCLEMPGVEAVGGESARIDYISFGDAVNDGQSFFTPHSPDLPESLIPYTEEMCRYKLRLTEGNLIKSPEGYRNAVISDSQMSIVNKTYKNFRAEASFNIFDGDGWCGFSFGKPSVESRVNSGYSLRLDKNGEITLCKGDVILCRASAPKVYMQTRLVLEVKNNRVTLYSGRTARPIMQTALSEYSGGYFSFATGNASANIGNFNICSDKDVVYSNFIWNYKIEKNNIIATSDGNGTMFLRGYAFTDYALTTTVKLNRFKEGMCSAGLLLSNMYGIDNSHEAVGIFLSVNSDGELRLEYKGEDLLPRHRLENPEIPTRLTVIKQNRNYKIYVGNNKNPVFEYEEPILMGSVYSLESHNSNTVFQDIAIRNIEKGQNPLEIDICKYLK